jgi:hypothetical protein
MNAVDTKILIYVHDPRDASKQMIAGELVANLDDGLLLWQTACEFLAASRKLVPYGYSYEQALADIRELMSYWSTAIPTWAVLDRGESLLARYSLSYTGTRHSLLPALKPEQLRSTPKTSPVIATSMG